MFFFNQKFWMRTNKSENIEQNETYISTLVVFLMMRYCFFSLDNNDVKVSINNTNWGEFGDIVIEITDKDQQVIENHAFQVKQTQYRRHIPLSTITAEKGKFSLKKQCEIFNCLRKKKNYDKTLFTLLTISDLIVDDNTRFIYDDEVLSDWKDKGSKVKHQWKDREVVITKYKRPHLANTSDDPDNICIFKIFKHNDENLDCDLSKFTFFLNQKKIEELRQVIKKTIEEKFVPKINITNDLVRSVQNYFKPDAKVHYKLTKNQILLKIPELILAPYIYFPDGLYESKSVRFWNRTLKKFDVIVIKNNKDTINRLYACLNHVLPAIGCSSLKIDKDSIQSEALKSEIFDGYEEETSRHVSIPFLYISLWKSGFAPLVLQAETENDLTKISSVISFLKNYNLPLRFILATNQNIDRCAFPQNLRTMINLQDLAEQDPRFFRVVLHNVQIPILGIMVSLEDIIKFNHDFLQRITPESFLNMLLDDFSFKNVEVPMTKDLIDNTFVVSDEVLQQVKKKIEEGTENKQKNLEYVVNIKGKPTRIEVPADI